MNYLEVSAQLIKRPRPRGPRRGPGRVGSVGVGEPFLSFLFFLGGKAGIFFLGWKGIQCLGTRASCFMQPG